MRNRKWKGLCSLLPCLLLLTSLAGCAPGAESTSIAPAASSPAPAVTSEPGQPVVEGQDAAALLLELQQKYAGSDQYEYTDPMYDMARDAALELEIGFDPLEIGMENYTEICGVFQDAGLTIPVSADWDREVLDNGRMRIKATPLNHYQPWSISSSRNDEHADNTVHVNGYYLYDRGAGNDWGNLARYYFAVFVDLETGEPLDKPMVTVFTIEHELEAPTLDYFILEDGRGGLSWTPVEGATHYYVLSASPSESGKFGMSFIVTETTDTQWIASKISDYPMNSAFYVSQSSSRDEYFAVVACNDTDTSAISNMLEKRYLASLLPYAIDYDTNSTLEDGEKMTTRPVSIYMMPSHGSIRMCDGSVTQRVLYYDVENATIEPGRWYTYDGEDLSTLEPWDGNILTIPFWPEGTTFKKQAQMMDSDNGAYDMDTVWDELAALADRQAALRGNAGTREVALTIKAKNEPEAVASGETIAFDGTIDVFATSALSEWLAIHMVAGESAVDLSVFKEAADSAYLSDAFFEALYQNPLALGVQGASMLPGGQTLYIVYDDDQATMLAKQRQVLDRVGEIVAVVVQPGMSELEIEYALNDYLCDTVEYDYAALENAAQYDYAYVDEEFNDSFTAYGALVNGVGVCASYAAAYKLLADAAGLECVVVTGTLLGSLSHAWNRVNVNGTWDTVDVTNNDNREFFNSLLNLPDEAAGLFLVQDNVWMMDARLDTYSSDSSDNEFYRVQQSFYGQDEIAAWLAEGLRENGSVTLRTDYDLSDEGFNAIAQQVVAEMQTTAIRGGFLLGTIFMELA